MRDVSFIADVAVLPRWIKVWQVLDYVAGVHPRFDRAKAESFLAKTTIGHTRKVRDLSKGMVAQLHLALVMAIDARLLVLDEPTLGLDILYRKQFYDSLLNDYFDRSRTIIVTTHQVEEIQHVITDLMFINRGRVVLSCSMEEIESRFLEVMVHPGDLEAARALKPIHERQVLGGSILMFDGVDRERVAALGDARTPSIADLFVAVIESTRSGQVSTQSNVMPESSLRSQGIAAAAMPAAQAHVLVGAARIVGEPGDLCCPRCGRLRVLVWLLDQHPSLAGRDARRALARRDAAARVVRAAIRVR